MAEAIHSPRTAISREFPHGIVSPQDDTMLLCGSKFSTCLCLRQDEISSPQGGRDEIVSPQGGRDEIVSPQGGRDGNRKKEPRTSLLWVRVFNLHMPSTRWNRVATRSGVGWESRDQSACRVAKRAAIPGHGNRCPFHGSTCRRVGSEPSPIVRSRRQHRSPCDTPS